MTTIRKQVFMAFAALTLGAAAAVGAHAQTTAPAAPAATAPMHQGEHGDHGDHHRGPSPEKMAEFRAKRIAHLHDKLKITAAQETAWKSFVASMQPAPRPQVDHKQAREQWAHLSAPQRMAKQLDMEKQHLAAQQKRLSALDSFYAVLSPDQKKTFDERAAHEHGHFGPHRGGWHGGWQHDGGGTARG